MPRVCLKGNGNLCFRKRNLILLASLIVLVIGLGYIVHRTNASVSLSTSSSVENQSSSQSQESVQENYSSESKPSPVVLNMNTYVDEKYDPYLDTSSLEPYYGPKQVNALDRVYNPLRYPYRSQDFYDLPWYPNNELPFQVIGCGGRRGPCMGGTQATISNNTPAINISNRNIAPINISTQGPEGSPQQVGFLYKTFGNKNEVIPLFGRRKYPNQDHWQYYTTIGPQDVKVNVITRHKNLELNTNDEVYLEGLDKKYRVTMYERDSPQYIPFV